MAGHIHTLYARQWNLQRAFEYHYNSVYCNNHNNHFTHSGQQPKKGKDVDILSNK